MLCMWLPACYVGETTKEMRRRHYGHRDEIKRRSDGICNASIYSCLCGSLLESSQEGNGGNDI
jgi:hypothetical protein